MKRRRSIFNLKRFSGIGSGIVVSILIGVLIFSHLFEFVIVSAATYTWTQTNWGGGTDGGTRPTHPTNQTGWTKYDSKDSAITADTATLTRATSTQNSITHTSDSDFSLGTHSSTTVSGSGSSASVGLTLTTGLLGEWLFTEGSGTSVADSSGNGNTGSLVNSPSWVTGHGDSGYGLSFNGSSNYMQSANNVSITGSSARTLTFWAKYSGSGVLGAMVGMGTAATAEQFTPMGVTGTWYFNGYGSADYNTSVTVDSNWHFHVVTYDGTTVHWYLDAVEIGSGAERVFNTGSAKLRAGARIDNDYYFPGIVDDIRVYTRVLSGGEIGEIKNDSATGTYTSGVIDTSQSSTFSTLTFSKTTPSNTSLTIDVRAGNTATPDGTWTSWQTNISSGGSITALGSKRYVQYRANATSSNVGSSPTLNDITINYTPPDVELISSAYNSTDATNALSQITWSASTSSVATVKFQLRTAPHSSGAPGTWSSWMGPDGTSSTYFTSHTGGETVPSTLRDGSNDQWFQYKAIFSGTDFTQTATLTSVTVQYVVNASPEITSVSATQNSDGTVTISYSARDSDTNSGTVTPGYVTPSFEYSVNGGSTYTAIASGALGATATSNKAVEQTNYIAYTATWYASTSVADVFEPDARIRVTANDNEGANNTINGASANFTLDTKVPTISSYILNVGAGTITLNANDDSQISYRFSNNSDLSADSSNAISGAWQAVNASTTTSTISWTFTGNYPPVYLQVKDSVSNQTNTSAIAPRAPQSYELRDISNINTGEYKELINWGVYSNSAGATFASYKIHRSTNGGSSYSLHTTITDQNLNYYIDTGLATSTTYAYKVQTVDSNGDSSAFTPVVSDTPNGQGGTDVAPPVISAVTSTSTQSTSITITWTTDELANSTVEYSTDSSFSSSKAVDTMVTSHSVTLTGLTPATQYRFRVKSVDIFSNTTTDSNGGTGYYTFTTSSGPVITNVTTPLIGDSTATISWNTSTNSDSYVVYANNSTLTNSTQAGSASLVGASASSSLFAHSVTLTGLTAGTTYYYYVKSTDAQSNTTIDNNGASYYSFRTTQDVSVPVISNITTPVLTPSAAVIVWSTDELATSQVAYGTASTSLLTLTTLDSTLTISHVATITGLSANSSYFFAVHSKDQANNEAISSTQTFTTTQNGTTIVTAAVVINNDGGDSSLSDTTPPLITEAVVSDIGASQAVITWKTNERARSFVILTDEQNTKTALGSVELVTDHAVRLTNLRMGSSYSFVVQSDDKSGNLTTATPQRFKTKFITEQGEDLQQISDIADLQKKLDTIIESSLPSLHPPVMSDIKILDITEDGATFTWNTNIKGSSLVALAKPGEYHPDTDKPYPVEHSGQEDGVTVHTVVVKNLAPNTLYHYQVRTKTQVGTVGTSEDATFNTKAGKVKPIVSGVTNTSFIISWSTDEPATSVVEYKNTVTGAANKKTDAKPVKQHEMVIDGLPQGSSYEVRVSGVNSNGNVLDGEPIKITISRDVTPPVVSKFKADSFLVPGRADRVQIVISWVTNEPATALLEYDEGAGHSTKGFANQIKNSGTLTSSHTAVLSSLKPATVYELRVTVYDAVGNKTVFGPRTVITSRQAESIVDVILGNFEDTFKFIENINP